MSFKYRTPVIQNSLIALLFEMEYSHEKLKKSVGREGTNNSINTKLKLKTMLQKGIVSK